LELVEPPGSTFGPDDLKDLWNSMCGEVLPKVLELLGKDREKAMLRLKEHPKRQWWVEVFTKQRSTPFCLGDNDRGWKADFWWIIANASNTQRLLGGRYDGRATSKPGRMAANFLSRHRADRGGGHPSPGGVPARKRQ